MSALPKPLPGTAKAERRRKRQQLVTAEKDHKAAVRRRDRFCRFPLCGCRRLRLRLDVSHAQHKGPGGNPSGDRSTADRMIYVCAPRHRESRYAIDQKTIRWVARTAAGANGPVAWEIAEEMVPFDLLGRLEPAEDGWVELGRERAVQELDTLSMAQELLLRLIASTLNL